jgi:hypothetical protein
MASSLFADAADFVAHVNTALPISKPRGEQLFRDFQAWGHIARQEDTGLTVSPKLWGGNLAGALTEVSANAPGRVPVVMLSSPEFDDAEFDRWAQIVQTWAAGLPDQTRGAFAREIKVMKHVDDGIPLSVLHKDMPSSLLFTYRRAGDFVIVIEAPGSKRRILTTKGIG